NPASSPFVNAETIQVKRQDEKPSLLVAQSGGGRPHYFLILIAGCCVGLAAAALIHRVWFASKNEVKTERRASKDATVSQQTPSPAVTQTNNADAPPDIVATRIPPVASPVGPPP